MKTRVCDLWSSTLRWDVQLAGSQPRDRGKIFTRTRAVKDVMLHGAPVNAAYVASVRVTFPTMELREDKARWFRIKRRVAVWQRRETRCPDLMARSAESASEQLRCATGGTTRASSIGRKS